MSDRYIHLDGGFLLEAEVPHVADDPYDLHFARHLLTIVEPHAAADRVAPMEELSRERLVDDGHRR